MAGHDLDSEESQKRAPKARESAVCSGEKQNEDAQTSLIGNAPGSSQLPSLHSSICTNLHGEERPTQKSPPSRKNPLENPLTNRNTSTSENGSWERAGHDQIRRYPTRQRAQKSKYLNDFIKKLENPEDHVALSLNRSTELAVKIEFPLNGGLGRTYHLGAHPGACSSLPTQAAAHLGACSGRPTHAHPQTHVTTTSRTTEAPTVSDARQDACEARPKHDTSVFLTPSRVNKTNKACINEPKNGVIPTTLKVYSWFDEHKHNNHELGLSAQQVETLVSQEKVVTNGESLQQPEPLVED